MSFSMDVNILLYASDASSPFSGRAREFLSERSSATDVFYLTWPTIMGYLRMATHPAIFSRPLSPDEAAGNIAGLLGLPHVRTLSEEDGFWGIYTEVGALFPLRGNAVPDAHIASLLRQHGVTTFYSNDADFRRFSFLKVVNPFT